MKRKVVALGLALVMCLSLSVTAFAASSSGSSNSSNNGGSSAPSAPAAPAPAPAKPVEEVVNNTAAGAVVAPEKVIVAVPSADGTAKAVTLNTVVAEKQAEVVATVQSVAALGAAAPAESAAMVNSILTAPASPVFTATVQALAEIKGADMVVNNCGTVKTAAVAKDALGNTIASAGVIKNVTAGALVMLMSINADGTIEYVEGIVDPLTGSVLGAFQGTPSVITVLVLA